jgi:very-short-patch-repair endonuclease
MKYVCPEEARTKRGNLRYLKDLRTFAERNRNYPTVAESILWSLLRNKKMGVGFLRQKPMERFVLDFYSSKLLLDIEVDGDSHDGKLYYDKGRDERLAIRGIVTVRYTNEEIQKELLRVKDDLKKIINERISLLSKGEAPKGRGI